MSSPGISLSQGGPGGRDLNFWRVKIVEKVESSRRGKVVWGGWGVREWRSGVWGQVLSILSNLNIFGMIVTFVYENTLAAANLKYPSTAAIIFNFIKAQHLKIGTTINPLKQ